jgi:hypothetical protein
MSTVSGLVDMMNSKGCAFDEAVCEVVADGVLERERVASVDACELELVLVVVEPD